MNPKPVGGIQMVVQFKIPVGFYSILVKYITKLYYGSFGGFSGSQISRENPIVHGLANLCPHGVRLYNYQANTLTQSPPFFSLKIAILNHVGPFLVPRCCNMDARWPKMALISFNRAQLTPVLADFDPILASS